MTSSVFVKPLIQRERFDPKNDKHLESLEVFIRTGNWGTIQFFPELPYNEVPMTVLMKYAEHMSGVTRESSVERNDRLSEVPGLIRFAINTETPKEARLSRDAELKKINESLPIKSK
jgi:hypothetical protein